MIVVCFFFSISFHPLSLSISLPFLNFFLDIRNVATETERMKYFSLKVAALCTLLLLLLLATPNLESAVVSAAPVHVNQNQPRPKDEVNREKYSYLYLMDRDTLKVLLFQRQEEVGKLQTSAQGKLSTKDDYVQAIIELEEYAEKNNIVKTNGQKTGTNNNNNNNGVTTSYANKNANKINTVEVKFCSG